MAGALLPGRKGPRPREAQQLLARRRDAGWLDLALQYGRSFE